MARGLPLDYYAYPTVGLPDYTPIGTAGRAGGGLFDRAPGEPLQSEGRLDRAGHGLHAGDAGGRQRHRQASSRSTYDQHPPAQRPGLQRADGRRPNSPILLDGYNGSYILTFAGYNAGRGRVRQWIAAYGDPRDPKVDPIDWVERIPIAETRNYVQRIMENLQVYRARFGGGTKLLIEADLKRGGGAN